MLLEGDVCVCDACDDGADGVCSACLLLNPCFSFEDGESSDLDRVRGLS
jgi:hypothetical protein